MKKKKIMQLLSDLNYENCLDLVQKCFPIVDPGIPHKLRDVLSVIPKAANLADKLLDGGDRSFYQIRNDIVHGNCCENDLEFTAEVDEKLHLIREYSYQVITGAADYIAKITDE